LYADLFQNSIPKGALKASPIALKTFPNVELNIALLTTSFPVVFGKDGCNLGTALYCSFKSSSNCLLSRPFKTADDIKPFCAVGYNFDNSVTLFNCS